MRTIIMVTTFSIKRYLLVTWALATSWLFLFSPTNLGAVEAGGSEQLISTILADNERWLQPPVSKLSYTFRMKHTNRDDLYEVEIRYKTPGHLTVVKDGRTRGRKIDNTYDTNNSAYPPRLLTILQGVTLFGPMQELTLVPEDHRLTEMGEDVVAGRQARVLQLVPRGKPSRKALSRWKEKMENSSRVPQYWYVLAPAKEDHQGEIRGVIQAECLFEEGPSWSVIQEDLSKDPTSLTWNPPNQGRGRRARTFRAFLLPGQDGGLPFLLEEGHESAQMLPRVLITEGKHVRNEALHESLKDILPKPARILAMRIGCGVWGSWYGYSGGGATEDRIWVDRSAGTVLREEGYHDGNLRFTIEYGDFEQLPDGKSAPQHVIVRLLDGKKPWSFDMRFSTHGGKIWLLRELTEYQGKKEVARAWISDVEAE